MPPKPRKRRFDPRVTDHSHPDPPQPDERTDLLTLLTSGSETLTSDAPLIRAFGDIDAVWPDDCDNELPELKANQERDIDSSFEEATFSISFLGENERRRDHSNMLPEKLFRTQYETSKTLSYYVDQHTHPAHRKTPHLQLHEANAFQSIGKFHPVKNLNREDVERHLVWNTAIVPSTFVSTFNDIGRAIKRAEFHYNESQRIGMRILVAEITTVGLVAATVKGRMSTTVTVWTKTREPGSILPKTTTKSATKIRDMTIPVWVRATAVPKDWSAINYWQFVETKADMWLSITELRRSDLKRHTPRVRKCDTVGAKGHDYEWLACGFIPKSCILRVMPFDGRELHQTPHTRIVRSIKSPLPWVWDRSRSIWFLDARLYRTACFLEFYGGNKFKDVPQPVPKLQKRTKKSRKDQNAAPVTNPYASSSANSTTNPRDQSVCCSECGQKKPALHVEDEIDGPLSYLDLAMMRPKRGLC